MSVILGKGQGGYSAVTLAGMTAALVALGIGYATQYNFEQTQRPQATAEKIAMDIEATHAAFLACYNVNRRWCTVAEAGEYIVGDLQSPIAGELYNITPQLDGSLSMTLNTGSPAIAGMAKRLVPGGEANGSELISSILPPTDVTIFTERLSRFENAQDADRILLETDIDGNEFDFDNLQTVTAELLTLDNITAEVLTTQTMVVGTQIDLEGLTIEAIDGTLTFSDTVAITGDTIVSGDVISTEGADITGFNLLSVNSLDVANDDGTGTVVVTDLAVDNGTIGSVFAEVGNIDTVDVTEETSFSTLEAESLTISDTATIQNIQGVSLTATTGDATVNNAAYDVFQNINTGSIQTEFATIDTMSGQVLVVTESGTITTIEGTQATFDSGLFDGLEADSLITQGDMVVSGDILPSLAAQIETINSGVTPRMNVTGAGTGVVDVELIDVMRADETYGRGEAGDVTVSERLVVGTESAPGLADIDRVTAGDIETSALTTGGLISDSINVLNTTVFNSVPEMENLTVLTSVTAQEGAFDSISADSFAVAGNSVGEDFMTSVSSVNANASELEDLDEDIRNCVEVTEYCIPDTPSILLRCVNCSISGSGPYIANLRAEISGCRQGCNYNWSITGNASLQGCSSGSVSAGANSTAFCNIEGFPPSRSTVSGTVTITVNNPVYSTSGEQTANYNFFNDLVDPPPPEDYPAGCFFDTFAYDTVNAGSCSGNSSDNSAAFSFYVGDMTVVGTFGDIYSFSEPDDFSARWEGDCTANTGTCIMTVTRNGLAETETYSATVTVNHAPSQSSWTEVVTATINWEDDAGLKQ